MSADSAVKMFINQPNGTNVMTIDSQRFVKIRKAWKSRKSMRWWNELSRGYARLNASKTRVSNLSVKRQVEIKELANEVSELALCLKITLRSVILQMDDTDDRVTNIETAAVAGNILSEQDLKSISSNVAKQLGPL